MFKTKSDKIDISSTDTLIGEGTVFEGRIRSEAGLRVEGTVIGSIECLGDVIIGEKGRVQSDIKARNIVVAGQVTGDVIAKDKLSITSVGKLIGNLSAGTLAVEEGGIFQGSSAMEGSSKEHTEPIKAASQSQATA